ncbi:MAG: hypothetical protein LV480_10750 [Methylacidiphilales bacterium]|nr:hypothetical protein [Candidatus Methylacidiphilales bacterium]
MRRQVLGWIAWSGFLFQGGFAVAQNSIDTLQEELNEATQQHKEVTSQVLSNFFSQLDSAMAGPDAAIALYQQAGGALPDPMPVVTQYENETETEKETRQAQDQANLSKLGGILEIHCGLMHYAALFVVKPDQKGLKDEWVAWLQQAAQLYPQLAPPAPSAAPASPGNDQNSNQHKKKRDAGNAAPAAKAPAPYYPLDMKTKAVSDSIISKFLGFNAWDDKEQGKWSVQDLPMLYRTNVLDPLRTPPTAATLAAWDTYIAMENADEPDTNTWTQVDYPPLQFERACDDYTVSPSTEKLEGLVNLIKAYPTYPKLNDWITRVKRLINDYSVQHGGKSTEAENPAPAPAPSGNPNVSVTTVQKGDMTVITTHTNSAPAPNPPPAP